MRPAQETRCLACDRKFADQSDIAEQVTGPTTCVWRLCVNCQSNGYRFEHGARKTWWLISPSSTAPRKCWEQRNWNESGRKVAAMRERRLVRKSE